MKPLLTFALCAVLFSACTPKAQLVTLRGNNVSPTPEGLVLDTDTLTLRYNFSSERGQMHLELINKLNQPLYVDWKRSSFITGQSKVDYWYDVADVNLLSSNSTYSRYLSTSGTVVKADQISFIPPQTKLKKHKFVVLPRGTVRLSGTPTVQQEKTPAKNKPTPIDVYTYKVDESPLIFRNYLTLSTDKDFKTEFHIDTRFWASEVRIVPGNQLTGPTQQSDGTYTYHTFNKPDGFYVLMPAQ